MVDDDARIRVSERRRGNLALFVPPVPYRDLSVPNTFRHRVFATAVVKYLFRPKRWLSQLSRHWHPPEEHTVALHVRRADQARARGDRRVFPLAAYIALANQHFPHAHHFVVFTDDDSVVSEVAAFAKHRRRRGIFVNITASPARWRPQGGVTSNVLLPVFDGKPVPGPKAFDRMIIDAVLDLILIARCRHFIGSGYSHFSAVAGLLQQAKGHVSAPRFVDEFDLEAGKTPPGFLSAAVIPAPRRWGNSTKTKNISRRWEWVVRAFVDDPHMDEDLAHDCRQQGLASSDMHELSRVLAPAPSSPKVGFDVHSGSPFVQFAFFDEQRVKFGWQGTTHTSRRPCEQTQAAAVLTILAAEFDFLGNRKALFQCLRRWQELHGNASTAARAPDIFSFFGWGSRWLSTGRRLFEPWPALRSVPTLSPQN